MMKNPETNRRSFFRIRDEAYVVYRKDSEAQAGLAEDTEWDALEAALNTAINMVWREHPSIAEALGLLNRKLDRLGDTGEHERLHLPPDLEPVPVNLSGAGIAFTTREPFQGGVRLRLLLGLLPSHTLVRIRGQVVSNSEALPDSPGRWRTTVAFDEDEAQREILIRHTVQKQHARDRGPSG